MIERIQHEESLIAIIIRASFQQPGIAFFTPDEFSQQLGYMSRPKGYQIAPHVHKKINRQVVLTQEVLFVKSGRVLVDFFTVSQDYFTSTILEQGDVILLASGGHGFEMLEHSELIEVKQGPYSGEEDMLHIKPAESPKANHG